jgi:hypothetical protein
MADGSGLTAVFSGNQSSAYSGQPLAGVLEFFSEFPTQDASGSILAILVATKTGLG